MSIEYNKIHALAQARKKVLDEFGTDLVGMWPMNDPGLILRDLLRIRPLLASKTIVSQEAGLLDYAIKDQGVGAVVQDYGDYAGTYSDTNTVNSPVASAWKCPIPAGLFKGVDVKLYTTYAGVTVDLYISPAGLRPAESLSMRYKMRSLGNALTQNAVTTVQWTFPFALCADKNEWELIVRLNTGTEFRPRSGTNASCPLYYRVDDDTWAEYTGTPNGAVAYFYGTDPVANAWPAVDDLTVGFWVDSYKEAGTILSWGDTSGYRFRVYLQSGVLKAYVKNSGNNEYTLTGKPLHPGLNFVTVAYDRATTFALYQNGEKVDSTTPSDHQVLGGTLAFCIGARRYAVGGGALYDVLYVYTFDDLFVAKSVLTDAKIRELYRSFILAAPLMQTSTA